MAEGEPPHHDGDRRRRGLSAAFNTPLGGIVFAMEELTRSHIGEFRTAVLSSVIISGMTAQWLLGPYLLLGYPKLERVGPSFMYTLLAISAVAGALGVLSGKGVLLLDKIRRAIKSYRRKPFSFCSARWPLPAWSVPSVPCHWAAAKPCWTSTFFQSAGTFAR